MIQIGDKEGGDRRFVRTNRAPSLEESVTEFVQDWFVWKIAGHLSAINEINALIQRTKTRTTRNTSARGIAQVVPLAQKREQQHPMFACL